MLTIACTPEPIAGVAAAGTGTGVVGDETGGEGGIVAGDCCAMLEEGTRFV